MAILCLGNTTFMECRKLKLPHPFKISMESKSRTMVYRASSYVEGQYLLCGQLHNTAICWSPRWSCCWKIREPATCISTQLLNTNLEVWRCQGLQELQRNFTWSNEIMIEIQIPWAIPDLKCWTPPLKTWTDRENLHRQAIFSKLKPRGKLTHDITRGLSTVLHILHKIHHLLKIIGSCFIHMAKLFDILILSCIARKIFSTELCFMGLQPLRVTIPNLFHWLMQHLFWEKLLHHCVHQWFHVLRSVQHS